MADDLDEIERLARKAVRGPLTMIEARTLCHIETAHDHPDGAGVHICSIPRARAAEADLFVALVNEWPSLVARLRRAERVVEAARWAVEARAQAEARMAAEWGADANGAVYAQAWGWTAPPTSSLADALRAALSTPEPASDE
jgi:hypothetical protein